MKVESMTDQSPAVVPVPDLRDRGDLSGAMVAVGMCLQRPERCTDPEVKNRALAVSSAIQQAMQEHANLRLSEFAKDRFQYHRRTAQQ